MAHIPQGCMLGPFQFSLYRISLGPAIEYHSFLSHHCPTDSQLYLLRKLWCWYAPQNTSQPQRRFKISSSTYQMKILSSCKSGIQHIITTPSSSLYQDVHGNSHITLWWYTRYQQCSSHHDCVLETSFLCQK